MKRRFLLTGLAVSLMHPVWARKFSTRDGIAALKAFTRRAQSAQGKFTQTTYDQSGAVKGKPGLGTFAFERPGRFEWMTQKPYPQTIVSNGARLWMYDPELFQVTVKKLSESLSATPASILFGQNDIEKSFVLKAVSHSDALVWVRCLPKGDDLAFEAIDVGFDDEGQLLKMQLKDHFGQMTELVFEEVIINPGLAKDRFEFRIPAGVDIFDQG